MKILVTGGAGYIGSHTVLELIKAGHEVIIFDNLINGHKEAIKKIETHTSSKIDFVKGDLLNYQEILDVILKHKPNGIIHFAAYAEVGESVKDPNKYYENNNTGGVNLLKAMREGEVKYIVFSSTCATYGQPEKVPIAEDTPQNPINPYGRSKLFYEKMLADADIAYGIKHVALRYFNASGAEMSGLIGEDHRPESHLIPLIMDAAKGVRESITVFGTDYDTHDGTAVRDYIHVLDLADAHIKAIEYLVNGGESDQFNLGSANGYCVKEIIEKVKEVSGKDFKVVLGERRAGDPAKLIADNSKAKKILNWQPKYSLEDIITSAWKWEESGGEYS